MNYEAPKLEIILFQDVQIETTTASQTVDLGDWFEEGDY